MKFLSPCSKLCLVEHSPESDNNSQYSLVEHSPESDNNSQYSLVEHSPESDNNSQYSDITTTVNFRKLLDDLKKLVYIQQLSVS